jgi:hypothetical protein
MAVPTVIALLFKSAGTPSVFPLLNGTTLDTQDGGTFGSLETGTQGRVNARCIEAFGKRLVAVNNTIRERDQGGSGNWGVVYTWGISPANRHSSIRMVHPNGIPTLVATASQDLPYFGRDQRWATSTDGVTWTQQATGGQGTAHEFGDSVTFRDSFFQAGGGDSANISEFNASTNSVTTYQTGGDNRTTGGTFCVHDNTLYYLGPDGQSNALWTLFRLSGGSFSQVAQSASRDSGTQHRSQGSWAFPDGADIVHFVPGETGASDGDSVIRWTNVATSPAETVIDATVLSGFNIRPGEGSATETSTWDGIVDNNSAPGAPPAIHLWRHPGPGPSGTRTSYTWHYRALTHGGANIFTLGETVLGGTSNATGVVTETSSGKVHLTNVSGTFQNGEVITGQTSSDNATTTSTLTEQTLTSNGTSISANYSISTCRDSVGPYIFANPAARAEIGAQGILLSHSGASGAGFTLNETITGGTSSATGSLIIDNNSNIVVFPTNANTFQNGEVITGSISTETATLNAGPTDQPLNPVEVGGGTKYYFRVWGNTPATVTATLYSSSDELAPWVTETLVGVSLESGSPPGLAPTISGGSIINLPPDDGVRLWSLVHDADTGGFDAGDQYEIAIKSV